jgi:hypothetical protein
LNEDETSIDKAILFFRKFARPEEVSALYIGLKSYGQLRQRGTTIKLIQLHDDEIP